jgi:non-specific serine/threonine protein kinase
LLSDEERSVFRRAAVFAGGFTLAAGDLLFSATGIAELRVLSVLTALVDKSLVRQVSQPDWEPRFSMLETIRAYALVQLGEAGELQTMQRMHAEWCLGLAEDAEPALIGPEQAVWLERLEQEHENLRVALHWSIHGGDVLIGIRLAVALGRFWEVRGHLHEAHVWLEGLLPARHVAPPSVRARLCAAAGHLAFLRGDQEQAQALLEESLALSRAEGEAHEIVPCLTNLGLVALARADAKRARALFEEALATTRALGDRAGEALALNFLGRIAHHSGQQVKARQLLEESVVLRRATGDRWGTALTQSDLSSVLRAQGLGDAALAMLIDSLHIWSELKDPWGLAYTLETFGLHFGARQAQRAVRVIAAAAAVRERIGIRRLPDREMDVQRVLREIRHTLGPERYASAWAAGHALPIEQAQLEALSDDNDDSDQAEVSARPRLPGGLTRRETEVLRLIAAGQTNREIAQVLVVAPSTAERHVANILRKIGRSSRAGAAIWALQNGIVQPNPEGVPDFGP